MTGVNLVGETHTFKSPPLWGKASLSVVGKECLILHDRYHTAVIVYQNWTSLIHELEQYIDGVSEPRRIQVGPYLHQGKGDDLYLTSQHYPPSCGLDEGLVLRMGEAAVLLTQSSVRLLLQQLTGSLTTPTEDSHMIGSALTGSNEYFPMDGTDDEEPLTDIEI